MTTTPANTIPTRENRGLLPIGTHIAGMGTVKRVSLTAYFLIWSGGSAWAPFDHVHGKPEPVAPLVVFG